jgi:tetratricopeptide (TPR) repeat protein
VATGLVMAGTEFEVLADDERVGPLRQVKQSDVDLLNALADRYVRAVRARSDEGTLVGIGRELWEWLDGEHGQLTLLLENAGRPVVFEVRGPGSPSAEEWAVLRAPWELLAPPGGGGFLAADELVRFSVARRLGNPRTAAALDKFRLGLAFMASSPRGQHELDFEAEEAAILTAVGETQLDLLVEDTGDPNQLATRLAEASGMPVVHLSCHGLNAWRPRTGAAAVPALMMEDDSGEPLPTTAGRLAELLGRGPRLVFVSACLTATGADAPDDLPPQDGGKDGALASHSLATALVTTGVPAVIGWDGSVDDRAATEFASQLYQRLARREDLAVAVGDARRALLNSQDPAIRAEWQLARVWLGPAGGGPVVGGSDKRSLVPPTHGTQVFLDRKRQVPVAAPEMFVGRRPELQHAVRALRAGRKAGVLLHGLGRLGKSSLAARIADRYPEHALAVVYGEYGALAILDAIARAVEGNPAARELIASRLGQVRDNPEAIQGVLTDLLAGPCARRGGALLLILDDLERILVANPAGPRKVKPDLAAVLAGVLRAFDPARTESRLLITSRFTFTLGGLEERLEDVPLRPMSPVARRKLQCRQLTLATEELPADRVALAERAVAVARGNPGLQDLAVRRLAYAKQVSAEHAEAAIAGIETYLRQGDLPADEQAREFLENLALDALLAEAGTSGVALLRATTLFGLPVPEPVIKALAEQVGGSPDRLRGLGLLVPSPDLYDPDVTALAADPLSAGRAAPLTDSERAAIAAIVTGPLLRTWGGTPQPNRSPDVDLELTRLALLAGDPDVIAACAAAGVVAMLDGPAIDAFRLGQAAIALLDQHQRTVPLALFSSSVRAAVTSGDGPAGEALLDRAERQIRTAGPDEAGPLDTARILMEQAQRLGIRGEPERARQLFDQAIRLFTTAGSEREAALAWGHISDIAYRQGQYDEALHIRREVVLPVFQRFGDPSLVAVAWGKIADIARQRGDYDEALRIHREIELPAYERLGDAQAAAVAWSKIADIARQRGDYDETLRIRRTLVLPVFERVGDIRMVAASWGQIADITYERGDYDEALRIYREIALPIYERAGDTRSVAAAWGRIAEIAAERGDYDEALRILREIALPTYERLGDIQSEANAWSGIADIIYRQGEHDEALRIYRDVSLPVYERLGDTQALAVAWGKVADFARERGDYDEAAELQNKCLNVHRQLGNRDGIASATWGLAQIDLDRGAYESVLPHLIESWQALTQLQRADGIVAVGWTLGQILAAAGNHGDARAVLAAVQAAATKIGRADDARRAGDLLGQLPREDT